MEVTFRHLHRVNISARLSNAIRAVLSTDEMSKSIASISLIDLNEVACFRNVGKGMIRELENFCIDNSIHYIPYKRKARGGKGIYFK